MQWKAKEVKQDTLGLSISVIVFESLFATDDHIR